MFQKTFIRFAVFVAFTFTVGILLMAFHRSQPSCQGIAPGEDKKPIAHYGEYVIWESLSSTVLIY